MSSDVASHLTKAQQTVIVILAVPNAGSSRLSSARTGDLKVEGWSLKSPGQIEVVGLDPLISARDATGRFPNA
jgi:hypothetical protein